jgi:hypothetical protein
MQIQQIAKATSKVLQSYLTYQAILQIQGELRETNPARAIWWNHYVASHNIQNGEAFLEELLSEDKAMVLRILMVRAAIAESVLEFLPEMTLSGIQQANVEHRRQLLEQLTQTDTTLASADLQSVDPDLSDPAL